MNGKYLAHRLAGKRAQQGFTLVEVLVATLILSMAILTVSAAFKQFTSYRERMAKSELLYMSVLSIKDQIAERKLYDNDERRGVYNGIGYHYKVHQVAQAQSYVDGLTPQESGNLGGYEYTLFRIFLEMSGQEFEIYKTQYRNIYEDQGSKANIPRRRSEQRKPPEFERALREKNGVPSFVY